MNVEGKTGGVKRDQKGNGGIRSRTVWTVEKSGSSVRGWPTPNSRVEGAKETKRRRLESRVTDHRKTVKKIAEFQNHF